MRYRVTFVAGFATGYLLGARAGRERYEQIVRLTQRLKENPSVQETAGVLQAQASGLLDTAKRAVGDRVMGKVNGQPARSGATPYPDAPSAAQASNPLD